MPSADYVTLLLAEINNRAANVKPQPISSLYFGGGTPSLLPAEQILAVIHGLANAGFTMTPSAEVTIEINPATIDERKIDAYLRHGINRFSVGAQTFSESLLKMCGRRHSANDTRQTLELLRSRSVNYSFDLLFALPGQTESDLDQDLDEVLKYAPPHLSAYCLTVPEGHPMAHGRPEEDSQIAMFDMIERRLAQVSLLKYEISNFAQPGKESQHNLAYWTDRPYWGIGLSAHSYLPHLSDFGVRFWNPKDFAEYTEQSKVQSSEGDFPEKFIGSCNLERLSLAESITDFCHMHLRILRGLSLPALRKKYGDAPYETVMARLPKLLKNGLIELAEEHVRLTGRGQLLSNQVFSELHFSNRDVTPRVRLPLDLQLA